MGQNLTWLIFCFISIGFTVTYGLISKKILNNKDDHNPIAYASSLFVAVAIFSFTFYIISGVHLKDFANVISPQIFPVLVLNILCYSIAPSLYYRVLKNMPISEVTIIYSLMGIFALIIGLLIGVETFHFSRLIGGLIIIISIGLLTFKERKWKSNKYFWMLILATLTYAIAAILDNRIISANYFSTLFFQTLSFGIPSILILLINPKSSQHLKKIYNRRVYPIVLINALFFFVSFFTIYNAYKFGGDTSQVNLILSTEIVVTVIFAAIFLKERDNLILKIFAGVLAIIGVILLK